ncbi:hypothetical protein GGS23DRAFT_130025 [Durotheca rogersii]|uniref:uncharacterized protein n=1 Tax=Durotheca rogersii TaxID=419775 RepID=UPI002220608D|nr:uncharacterized protein GGS23DRAFT_130025 [Durotheca rogersii]KAI5861757.1 hypothetical protein GGS23DRAFT_130025 [Durotheca rogersii]
MHAYLETPRHLPGHHMAENAETSTSPGEHEKMDSLDEPPPPPPQEPALPYWQVNVPEAEREATCPAFLRELSAKDRGIIGTPDAAYRRATWGEVRAMAAENRLDAFRRVPSDLRRYLAYGAALRREHGSVLAFVLAHRLRWPAADVARPPRRPLFPPVSPAAADDPDVRVLRNDWPYGVDPRIVHLVVWTKFALPEDPATGDLTDDARAEVDAYVQRTFTSRVPPDRVIWFKNWRSLKSVHAIEHFHVMLYDPDPRFVDEITHGDVPLCERALE